MIECEGLAMALFDMVGKKKLPGGSGRDVFALNGKVIKVATSPKGLQQNYAAGFGDFNFLDQRIAERFEEGDDYIIVEKVPRNDKAVRAFLKPLKEFSPIDWEQKSGALQEAMVEAGLEDFLNYSLLWNDFTSYRNWGQRADGTFVLIDEGALSDDITVRSEVPQWARRDWEAIKTKRRACRRLEAPND
jgi:hypothetical protein